MSKSKVAYFIGTVGIVVTVVFGFLVYQNGQHNVQVQKDVVSSSKVLKNAKNEFKQKMEQVDTEAFKKALNDQDQSVKSIALHNSNYITLNSAAKSFFETYYTWNNSGDYLKRGEKLVSKGIISSELAANKTVFDDGKDTTGGDYIKNTGLTSRYVDSKAFLETESDTNITALVKVVNSSSFSNGKNSGEATHYYQISYDKNSKNITNMSLVLTI